LFFCLDPSAGSGELQKNQKIKAELNSPPKKRASQTEIPPKTNT